MKGTSAAAGIEITDRGLIDYEEALKLQLELVRRRLAGLAPDTVIIAEHPPVITLGAKKAANTLLADGDTLRRLGIETVQVRRGGGATAHNPGQVIAYPIVHLGHLGIDVSGYVRSLEEAAAKLAASFGVCCGRRRGLPGVWVKDRKIASVGICVRRQVTFHGIAVNVSNDLEIFELLVPCGLESVRMTSVLEQTGAPPDMEDVRRRFAGIIQGVLPGKNA
jgi:lipoate-protein ligase B